MASNVHPMFWCGTSCQECVKVVERHTAQAASLTAPGGPTPYTLSGPVTP